MTICGSCYGAGGRWDDEVQDQWYPCVACDDIAAAREEGRREGYAECQRDVVAWSRRLAIELDDAQYERLADEIVIGEHVGASKWGRRVMGCPKFGCGDEACAECAREEGMQRGRAEEREDVVAWLRELHVGAAKVKP